MRTVVRWLSLILIFMVPWEDTVTIGTWGSLARLMGVAVAGFWMLTVLARGRLRQLQPFHITVVLFVLWNVASTFWSPDLAVTQQRIKTYAQLCLLALILWDLYSPGDTLRAGLQAFVLGAWVCAISTFANYLAGNESALYSGGRYTATGVNAVDLVVTLTLGMPLAWYLAISADADSGTGVIARLLNFAYLPAGAFAIVLTGSRTSLFAVVPAVLYVLWSSPRLKLTSRIVILAALVIIALTMPSRVPQSALDRLGTVGTSIEAGDLGGRVDLWRFAMTEFLAHPILGIGSGVFSSPAVAGTFVHNTYLSVLTETGIVGFILFLTMFAAVVHQVLRQPKERAGLWASILLVWAIGALSLTWEFKKPTWLFFTLVVASATQPTVGYRRGYHAEEKYVLAGVGLSSVTVRSGSPRPDRLDSGNIACG